MNDEELLAEIEDLLRTALARETPKDTDEAYAWIGRVSAVLKAWNRIETAGLSMP